MKARSECRLAIDKDPISATLARSNVSPRRPPVPGYLRSKSRISARFYGTKGETRLGELHEAGCSRLKFPRAVGDCQGVLVNTAGGMTGGDEAEWSYVLDSGARVELTTQSAEKIYRSDADTVRVGIDIKLGKRAVLAWLPQEVILFNGARFTRRLDVDMAESAQLTLLEMSVFGRAASGELVDDGGFQDRWVVRRQGRILFADSVRLDGDIAANLAQLAVGNGASAVATLLHVAPNAERRLGSARRLLSRAKSECGASAWDGVLVARFASRDAQSVRRDASAVAALFLKNGLPRIWAV